MSKISNVLTMIEYLSTGRKYSISELSEKLEVSPRMIRVYKDEIEKAEIKSDKKVKRLSRLLTKREQKKIS